ncbi:hypothetical protein C3Y94_025830 [Rhizobium ruizarguesonis]|uniref:hypothetical protein n=1 Tax=Rhizobium ruizarguesonis TaxID=2081791 RepID=UPI00163AB217|nr:hypothetical protein [Rhizobium ruizarguesonis]MBC2806574.1 hypothetical protein [Rhizobium ruizarguesonis]
MNIQHVTTNRGPVTIATYDGMAARFPGTLSAPEVDKELKIMRALDAQQQKAKS